MKRVIAAVLVLAAVGCGGDGNGDGGSIADRTKARMQELFEIVKGGDFSKAAPYIVVRGAGKDRDWKEVCDWANESDRPRVESACRSVRKLLDSAVEVKFLEFQTENESEGTWLIWNIQAGPEKSFVACLEVDGQIVLGDID